MAGNTEGERTGSGEIVGEATDPNGIRVVLLGRIWHDKVLGVHPEMASLVDAALDTVHAPDHVEADPVRRDRLRYFASDIGPSRWLVVVVSYEQVPARVISAFAHRKDPSTWSA